MGETDKFYLMPSQAEFNVNVIPAPLLSRYSELGQGHVFDHVSKLSREEFLKFMGQLEKIPLESTLKAFHKERSADRNHQSQLKPPEKTDIISVCDTNKKIFHETGLQMIREGEIAVVTLAGGQGTRLGSTDPKGCYNIGLPSGKSLFQLQSERLKRVSFLSKAERLPLWLVMTSAATDKTTRDHFSRYDLYPEDRIIFFMQGQLSAIDDSGKLIMKSSSSLAMSPDGNGGIYEALRREGIIQLLLKHSIKAVHMYCVDNALVKVADPIFLGASKMNDSDCSSKTVIRTDPSESVGLFCRLDSGKLGVVEYSEIDAVNRTLYSNEQLVFRHANIANHYFTVDFLSKVCGLDGDSDSPLTLHLAQKKIPSISSDGVTPVDPPIMGYKLEAFIFDIFGLASKPLLIECSRDEEFAPLKNAPGATRDTPEHCMSAVFEVHRRWMMKDPNLKYLNKGGEISPLDSYDGEYM